MLNLDNKNWLDRVILDIEWIFNTQPLMQPKYFQFSHITNIKSLLNRSDIQQQLIAHLQNKNLKMLGTYFEALWEFCLITSDKTQLLGKNIQVFENNQTLGEFDFIYLDKLQNKYKHLEVAIKYYLGVPELNTQTEQSSLNAWIGPNKNDSLDKKFHKLFQHQSKLSKGEAAQLRLEKLGVPSEKVSLVESEVCLLGYLFYPYGQTLSPPIKTTQNHNKGVWLSLSQLNDYPHSYWMVIEKPFWLKQVNVKKNQLQSTDEIKVKILERMQQKHLPVLVASFDYDSANNIGQFIELVFVVPDDWNGNW